MAWGSPLAKVSGHDIVSGEEMKRRGTQVMSLVAGKRVQRPQHNMEEVLWRQRGRIYVPS